MKVQLIEQGYHKTKADNFYSLNLTPNVQYQPSIQWKKPNVSYSVYIFDAGFVSYCWCFV